MKKLSMLNLSNRELLTEEKRKITGGRQVAPCLSVCCECDNGDNSNWQTISADTQKNAG